MKHVIVGTAGHIDHGKSALVRALTGTDPDRLAEEKRRGITIDLGFAHLDFHDSLRIGFIDVPGHERFVRNMLAGVGGIDLVLLVVAADESIKPQTREHFDICKLLGIHKGLVAITKADLVDSDILELVRLETQDFVSGSFLDGSPVIPVSAKTGAGTDHLKTELHRLSLEVPPKSLDLPFRLPIDRAFVIKGFGAVVTGTLISGSIHKEAEAEIFPLGRRVRVRGIEVHNEPSDLAVAGQRTALNLAGIEAKEITRGMMLTAPGVFEPTFRLDCRLNLLPTAGPMKNRARVHFHCWTSEMLAEVVLLEGKDLKPGESAFSQLRLTNPGLFVPGDHFIIRQFSPVTTIGGGVVLDNHPGKHHLVDPQVREFLTTMERGEPAEQLEWLTRQYGDAQLSALTARTGWRPEDVLRGGTSLQEKGKLILLGHPPNQLIHREYFQELAKRVVEQLEKFHVANPLVEGVSKEELRLRLVLRAEARPIPSPMLFNALLQDLTAQGKVNLLEEMVRLGGRGIQMSPEEAIAKEQISAAFKKAGLTVPPAGEILATVQVDRWRAEKLLRILLKENVLLKVTEDLIFHQAAISELRELLSRRKVQNHRLRVADFKDLTGLSRKYAIPLLEYLDRQHVTRRQGEERIIL